jgi:hypothetical protein
MKQKTKMLAERFSGLLSSWQGIECVVLNEAALPDTLDPYFALILDAYFQGSVPGAQERRLLYGEDLLAFETSNGETKDRFLVKGIPIRVEYKSTRMIEELVSIAAAELDRLHLIKDGGTYVFYRLSRGDALFSRTGWLDGIRERISSLSPGFWQAMRDSSQSKMEHFLSDMGAALIQDDNFHYLVSSALFIKSACLTLFCINRCFEPSHRAYYEQVCALPVLPEAFGAQLENYLSTRPDNTPERKYSLAQVIARGIVGLDNFLRKA